MARRRGVVVVAMQECSSCGWMDGDEDGDVDGDVDGVCVCVCVSEGVCVWVTYLVLRYL